MIALHHDYLLFQLQNGESVPCSADMIAVEIVGEANGLVGPETLRHAAASVFFYFKFDLGRESVTIGEFSLALEKALHHLGYSIHSAAAGGFVSDVINADLRVLATETGASLELLFFPRLRDELRARLRTSPRVVRFYGLRGCVKQMVASRRWTIRCQQLQDQIVDYLRSCLSADSRQSETSPVDCSLVVE